MKAFDTANLVLPMQYLQGREHVFPSYESWRWFTRVHHDELVRRRALVMPAGRKLVNVPEFDQAVIEIGAQRAANRREASA
ncbi:MAG: hypothetical protein LC125_02690 [Burkholderiales bacterium]|nr:hypothetical protein [Burkholderiales bacterium]